MQNVGALRMPEECSTRCLLELWSLGWPYLEDVSCIGMVRKLLNIMNICVKKLYGQMILLLFVFCQLVAMQVKWWMKAICCYMSVTTVYMIFAKLEHYTCKVDLLGCVDHLQEAENMNKVMSCEPDVTCYCIQAHQHSSWYSTLIYEKSVSFQRLPHFHEVILEIAWNLRP
jgi:hypothetical protein